MAVWQEGSTYTTQVIWPLIITVMKHMISNIILYMIIVMIRSITWYWDHTSSNACQHVHDCSVVITALLHETTPILAAVILISTTHIVVKLSRQKICPQTDRQRDNVKIIPAALDANGWNWVIVICDFKQMLDRGIKWGSQLPLSYILPPYFWPPCSDNIHARL